MTGFSNLAIATDRKPGRFFSGSRIDDRNIADGLSNTVAVGERHTPPVPDGTASDMEHDAIGDTRQTILAGATGGIARGLNDPALGIFGSSHPGIAQFLFLDGHVTAIDDDIDSTKLLTLCTMVAGKTVNPEN